MILVQKLVGCEWDKSYTGSTAGLGACGGCRRMGVETLDNDELWRLGGFQKMTEGVW